MESVMRPASPRRVAWAQVMLKPKDHARTTLIERFHIWGSDSRIQPATNVELPKRTCGRHDDYWTCITFAISAVPVKG